MLVSFIGLSNGKIIKAEENTNSEYAYVLEVLPRYLSMNDFTPDKEYIVSSAYTVYNWNGGESEKNCYLVSDGDNIVATVLVQEINDVYYSSFYLDHAEKLNAHIVQGVPFALGNYQGRFIACTMTDIIVLSGDDLTISDRENISVQESQLCALDMNSEDKVYVAREARSVYATVGQPPWVRNSTDPVAGKPLCWAACVASVLNYKRGNSEETADIVFRDCWQTVSCTTDVTRIPTGTYEWIEAAFEINSTLMTGVMSNIDASDIEVILSVYNKPIMMALMEADLSSGHEVVLFEFGNSSSHGYFKVMDPNEIYPVTINVPYETLQDTSFLPYVTDDYTYRTWARSFY